MRWRQRWQQLKSWLHRARPAPATWAAIGRTYRWAAVVLLVVVTIVLLRTTAGVENYLGILAIMGLLLVICFGLWLLLGMVSRLSPGLRAGVLLLLVPLVPIGSNSPWQLAALHVFLLVALALAVTGVLRWRRGRTATGVVLLSVGAGSLLAALVAFSLSGWQVEDTLHWSAIAQEPLQLPDPAEVGEYDVLAYSYGSGQDRHRPAFAQDADWISESVDGSKLIDGWDGAPGWARSSYWGFDSENLPVQGRVWVPDGEGSFPLVLIVHGNHEGADFSDVGYAYLGELFASRGAITVSVDENFLNFFAGDLLGGPDGGLEEESDARAWMLLQHLVQWRDWSADADHAMHGKADLSRVVLIGHSRGGEAVSEAAHFNRLGRYPDDGTVAFDFDFGIQGIIAIAPVDAQYNPRDRPTPLSGTNLLVIHGSHDSDVDAFAGYAMYSRLKFAQCDDCFKSSFYLFNANHGQFNTSWGAYDAPFPAAAMLNLKPLIAGEDQRRVASVMFSAFLETVLFGRREYQRFLAGPERGARWFPASVRYLSNYLDAGMIRLVDYEEDSDLASGADSVAEISGEDLDLWKEAEVPLRWRDMDTAAVLLGWGSDPAAAPRYTIELLQGGRAVSPEMAFSFAAAMSTEAPAGVDDFTVPESLSFEIELEDTAGGRARVSLGDRRPLHPQVDPVLFKVEALSDAQASEPTFQRYHFAFGEWQQKNPALNLSSIAVVRFLFPADVPASIWLDDIVIVPDGL